MGAKPHVSIRKHIKWGDAPAGENTNTLVLTSRDNYYVDVRVFLPTSPAQSPSPDDPNDDTGIERLEWGFAGRSITTPAFYHPSGELDRPAHTEWHHWVDNKTTEEVLDEGDMYPLENSNEVLEKGSMVNPNNGKVEAYEELWEDLNIGNVGNEKEFKSWVLQTEDHETRARGIMIRIGEWVEAVLRVHDSTSVVRWCWDDAKAWRRIFAIGSLGPEVDSDVFFDKEISMGDTFKISNGAESMDWKCIESYNWSGLGS